MAAYRHKIALVGLGRMGKNHCRVLSECPQVELVAVVDPRITLDDGTLPAGVQLLSSMDQLSSTQVDGVIIAVPTPLHYEVVRQALKLKKPILVEKPICSTYTEGIELDAQAKEAGTTIHVGHVERHNPAIKKLKEVVSSGIIGTPIHCSVTRVGGYPEHVAQGDNVLLDLAVHDIDVVQMLFGEFNLQSSISHCTIRPSIFDTAQINGICGDRVSTDIHVNWITPTKIRTVRLTGSHGVCYVDYILQSCVLYGGNLLKQVPGKNFMYQDLIELYKGSDKIELGITKLEPLRAQLEQFAAHLCGREHTLCSAIDAAKVVRIAEQSLSRSIKISNQSLPTHGTSTRDTQGKL
jgi:UDP-N-acetylglucosamine 3-dehydrogenase